MKNKFSVKIIPGPELKTANFLILDFDKNNSFTHFCFSELLILREKKVRGFICGPSTKKKLQIFEKYWKITSYRRVAKKRYNFAPGAANYTFFTHPVCQIFREKIAFHVLVQLWCVCIFVLVLFFKPEKCLFHNVGRETKSFRAVNINFVNSSL